MPVQAGEPRVTGREETEPRDRSLPSDLIGVEEFHVDPLTVFDRVQDMDAARIIRIAERSLPHADVTGGNVEVARLESEVLQRCVKGDVGRRIGPLPDHPALADRDAASHVAQADRQVHHPVGVIDRCMPAGWHCTQFPSRNMIFCVGSSSREGARSGRRCSCSAISAIRADRLEERTAEKVAIARTSVPAAVASEATVSQLSAATTSSQSGTAPGGGVPPVGRRRAAASSCSEGPGTPAPPGGRARSGPAYPRSERGPWPICDGPWTKGGLMSQQKSKRPPTTTDAGIPVASQEHSLTVGPDGPVLLQDFYLIEQMANFNRERIPERQPHAKGGGAFGTFVVKNDVSRYTKAAVFQPGTETELVLRFSTVAGERGSPDTWRDPRGFAVKFYTSEGNLDIVGNNTPVFFIRDPIKFQNFIRSQKRLAANNLRDPDMQWDFWTLSPESAHQVTWLMGDRGIPRSWRHMNGYSSHTYMWVNAANERFWVKYHFKTDQGIEFLTQAEADRIAGEDADYHQRDLYEAIERGEFPSWSLKMQIMPFEEAKTYRFNPFDLTKVWPHGDYPLIDVGHAHPRPQRDRLPHRDGAGGVPAQQHRARDRPLARQDAAGPRLLLRRCAPGPARRQLPADSGEPPQVTRAQLLEGRGHAGRERHRPRLLPELGGERPGRRHRHLRRARRVGGRR